MEVLWKLDGRWTTVNLRRGEFRNWFGPYSRKGWTLGCHWCVSMLSDSWGYMLMRSLPAWLNILAAADAQGIKGGVNGVLLDHYHKYGRTFFSR